MDREEEKEEVVDLWLLAKTLKKKEISNSTIEKILRALQESKTIDEIRVIMKK